MFLFNENGVKTHKMYKGKYFTLNQFCIMLINRKHIQKILDSKTDNKIIDDIVEDFNVFFVNHENFKIWGKEKSALFAYLTSKYIDKDKAIDLFNVNDNLYAMIINKIKEYEKNNIVEIHKQSDNSIVEENDVSYFDMNKIDLNIEI
ncbi:MAG: hypothetical protein Terrestrivirus5_113 [Terrestrivirus sp.]|uniref:Uncharacterized protein n=1 Tax=Terrestrivirus sp. TaxID=2487775 RepID=A0A3G4ZQM3_9VIRU|nr:MAG: hypothetical protein Terrestrivirus5_113 [Terrestrivirus sp.]